MYDYCQINIDKNIIYIKKKQLYILNIENNYIKIKNYQVIKYINI